MRKWRNVTQRHQGHQGKIDRERILRQLDKMIASGRITAEEANRLRAAGPHEFEAAVQAISQRHIRERNAGD